MCTAGVGQGPRGPQRGRTTLKVRRVWVVSGTAWPKNSILPEVWRGIIIAFPVQKGASKLGRESCGFCGVKPAYKVVLWEVFYQ